MRIATGHTHRRDGGMDEEEEMDGERHAGDSWVNNKCCCRPVVESRTALQRRSFPHLVEVGGRHRCKVAPGE